jgi:anaerobic selenocysteine-containing dehydrogenase
MSVADPERCLEAFKDCFVVSFNLYSDETAEALADIVLPDASYLERLDPLPNVPRQQPAAGLGDWSYQLRQPAVATLSQRRPSSEVLLEIGERLGIADAMNARINLLYGLRLPHALSPEERCSWEEMADRIYQGWFGPEHGLAWFRQNGVLTWPKRLEEAYWKPFGQARVPLRLEWLPRLGEEVRRRPQIGFDLQAVSYQVPWHTACHTCENPWLDEVSQSEPYSYFICLHPRTAAASGIADGDPIWVESTTGRRVRGRARLTEGIHPEVVAIADSGGHWARGMPVARGQGAFFNALQSFDLNHMASLTIDGDARVRVYKE